MKKCFIILQFGSKHEWMKQFIETVGPLGKYGWHWKIFTSNYYENLPDNVEAISMTIHEFNTLVEQKTDIKPIIYITKKEIPSVHVTDYMVAYGKIFEDYLRGFDFWGMMGGPDIVFGRLDHFISDAYLEDCDIFSDDPKAINGCFTLFRNTEKVNNLFKQIPDWEDAFAQPTCLGCTGDGEHKLFATDEYGLTEVMKKTDLCYKHPKYFPMHGHDRLSNKDIVLKDDGTLWELNQDTNPPKWKHAVPYFARELLFYHFSQTKRWPL